MPTRGAARRAIRNSEAERMAPRFSFIHSSSYSACLGPRRPGKSGRLLADAGRVLTTCAGRRWLRTSAVRSGGIIAPALVLLLSAGASDSAEIALA
jgi:hypothetical protein